MTGDTRRFRQIYKLTVRIQQSCCTLYGNTVMRCLNMQHILVDIELYAWDKVYVLGIFTVDYLLKRKIKYILKLNYFVKRL